MSEQRKFTHLAYISFKDTKKIYNFGSDTGTYQVGDLVVVETIRGVEIGKIAKPCEPFIANSNGLEIRPVLRKASKDDSKRYEANQILAKEAIVKCAELIEKLKLDMKLIECEYTLDRSKIIFVYVADERVDFRELLKELASVFKCRVELKQIGPRNKAKIVGGLGVCGMETCCSRFLNDFDVVSINMAKNQYLALNIQKLSGQCGKLMCCLKYEDQQYKTQKEGIPKLNSQLEYNGQKFRLTGVNLILNQAKIENRENILFVSLQELFPNYKG
ncbi:MAG: regulatory iron-sulfur-containing complex subunit RicT [Erysipelotrichaceae bacterium]